MARIYYRCEPFSKADVTLALESGVDGVIVPRAQVEMWPPFPAAPSGPARMWPACR